MLKVGFPCEKSAKARGRYSGPHGGVNVIWPEGDRCASSAEGKGLCTSDGKGTLECRSGILVKTNPCTSCGVMNDQVICTP